MGLNWSQWDDSMVTPGVMIFCSYYLAGPKCPNVEISITRPFANQIRQSKTDQRYSAWDHDETHPCWYEISEACSNRHSSFKFPACTNKGRNDQRRSSSSMARSVEHSTILSEFVTRVLVTMVIYRMMLQYTKILQPSAFVVCFCSLETVKTYSRRRGSRSDKNVCMQVAINLLFNPLRTGIFSCFRCHLLTFLFKINFYQMKNCQEHVRVSNVLDPDLGPNCLQRSLA